MIKINYLLGGRKSVSCRRLLIWQEVHYIFSRSKNQGVFPKIMFNQVWESQALQDISMHISVHRKRIKSSASTPSFRSISPVHTKTLEYVRKRYNSHLRMRQIDANRLDRSSRDVNDVSVFKSLRFRRPH